MLALIEHLAWNGLFCQTLQVAYATKKYSVDALFSTDAKTPVNASLSGLAPGVKLSFSSLLPDPSSAKLAIDYSLPYLALKAAVGLTVAPLVDVTASTGHNGLTVGGEVGCSSSHWRGTFLVEAVQACISLSCI